MNAPAQGAHIKSFLRFAATADLPSAATLTAASWTTCAHSPTVSATPSITNCPGRSLPRRRWTSSYDRARREGASSWGFTSVVDALTLRLTAAFAAAIRGRGRTVRARADVAGGRGRSVGAALASYDLALSRRALGDTTTVVALLRSAAETFGRRGDLRRKADALRELG